MRINENMMKDLRPMFQLDGTAAGGGSGATENVVPLDLTQLDDKKLNELAKADETTIKETIEKGTPPVSSPKVEEEEKTVTETPEQKTTRETAEAGKVGDGKPGDGKEEKLFAGTFKTKEDLIKGFVSTAKALNYNEKLLQKMADLALKTGDVDAIEEVYKDLVLAISRNEKAKVPGEQQPSAERKPDNSDKTERDKSLLPNTVDDAVRQEATRLTLHGALSELRGSRLIGRMERQGIQLPESFMVDQTATKEFLAKLENEIPWMYDQLENELTSLVNKHAKEVNEVVQAMGEAEVENPKRRESEIAKIKAEAKEVNLPVKDEEVTAFVTEALKQRWAYDVRNGIQFVREGAIADAWYLANKAKIREQVRINAEIAGRTQALTDLNGNKKKNGSSISSANIPADQAARREKTGTLDLSDQSVLASLSDEELNALNKDETKREALMPK